MMGKASAVSMWHPTRPSESTSKSKKKAKSKKQGKTKSKTKRTGSQKPRKTTSDKMSSKCTIWRKVPAGGYQRFSSVHIKELTIVMCSWALDSWLINVVFLTNSENTLALA